MTSFNYLIEIEFNFYPNSNLIGSASGAKGYDTSKDYVNLVSIRFYISIAILFVIVLGMPFHVAFYHVIRGSYNNSVWFLPYKVLCVWKCEKIYLQRFISINKISSFPCVRMPFDQNAGMGYAVTLGVQICAILIIGEIICLINTLFFGVYWYVGTFIQDLVDILDRIDDRWIQKSENKTEQYNDNNFSTELHNVSLFREFLLLNEDIFRYADLEFGNFLRYSFLQNIQFFCILSELLNYSQNT